MSNLALLIRNTWRQNRAVLIGVVIGLQLKDFIIPLWKTGNVRVAADSWLTRGLPGLPILVLIMAVCFALFVALAFHRQSMKGGYNERVEGYRND